VRGLPRRDAARRRDRSGADGGRGDRPQRPADRRGGAVAALSRRAHARRSLRSADGRDRPLLRLLQRLQGEDVHAPRPLRPEARARARGKRAPSIQTREEKTMKLTAAALSALLTVSTLAAAES